MRHTSPAPKTLTNAEQIKLLRETARNVDDLRDHMLFAIALGTGLRVGEFVALNVSDVKNGKGAKGVIALRTKTTKGNRGGEIALPERLRRKVSRYLRWKAERDEPLEGDAPLFCSRGGGRAGATKGSRLSKRGAQLAFKSWQSRLGFDRTCNFHMLRHYADSRIMLTLNPMYQLGCWFADFGLGIKRWDFSGLLRLQVCKRHAFIVA